MELADIESALQFVPPEDRDLWVKMAMAVKAEVGDDGFSLWDYWSRTAESYKDADARAVWRSVGGSGIGVGSLIYEAKQRGWSKFSDYVPVDIPVKPAPPPQPSTGAYATRLWLASDWSKVSSHPYAIAKGIDWHAGAGRGIASGKVVGQNADCIIVPVKDMTGKLTAVQCINAEGKKQTFGKLSGNGFVVGNTLDRSIRWFVCEGWADAVSLVFHHYSGNACAFAACGKSSMDTLTDAIVKAYAPDTLIVLEDADD
jgi:hypothetical protein